MKRLKFPTAIAFLVAILLAVVLHFPVASVPAPSGAPLPKRLPNAIETLPEPQTHPLPASLTRWRSAQSGDYFDQVQPVVVNYLLWSQFPITVFVEPVHAADQASPFTLRRSQTWVQAVQAAVDEWHTYLPLQRVDQAAGADISIWRSAPPLKLETRTETGDRPVFALPRARSAETRFELYAKPPVTIEASSPSLLAHRVAIYIRPDQAADYLQAAARHELGHGLGIWGHSPKPTDALYFSQVRTPAAISARDVNTLKRVYEQPTRLGWAMQQESSSPQP